MDAYSRLIRWIKLAQVAPGFDSHGFATTAEHITKTIDEHIRSEAGESVQQTKRAILSLLRHKDSHIAFAALYFLADYERLIPCGHNVPFSSWKWPSLEIECDIGGMFTELVGNKVVYQGGEAKLNYRGSSSSLNKLM